jgi:hypothetical protein
MDKKRRSIINKIPDFDVLSEDPNRCALIIQERLQEQGFENVEIIEHESIDDVIPKHIQIIVGKETIAFVFEPVACHNYNTIQIGNQEINVATIDTMLSFYLAFIYANKPYFEKDRILCMAQFLFEVEQKNRLEQKGLLKRFSIKCYGQQATLESMRAEKAEKFKELAHKKDGAEWNEWFFKYAPGSKLNEKVLSDGALKLSQNRNPVDSSSLDTPKPRKSKRLDHSKKSELSQSKSKESLESEKYNTTSYSIPVYKPKRTKRVKKTKKPRQNTFKRIFGLK